MKEPELTDLQISLIMKAALDNNAAIVQFCSLIYGQSREVKNSSRKEWHRKFTSQWETYQKTITEILELQK